MNRYAQQVPRAVWTDRYLNWLISILLHLGIGLVALFVVYMTDRTLESMQERPIVIPGSFEDPSWTHNATGPGPAGDALQPQDRLRELARSDGWQSGGTHDVAALAGGGGGGAGAGELVGIFGGTGASLGQGPSTDIVAAYGAPGGAGGGAAPRSSFYGTGGNARRIVYLIDRTGSLGNYYGAQGVAPPGTVKSAVESSVSRLVPLQYFAVLVFTGDPDGGTQVMGPDNLLIATPENKQAVLDRLRQSVAQGGINDLETVFVQAFRKAFELRPELIYFLTDGDMAESVLTEVRKLNPDQRVKINAVMFTQNPPGDLTPGDQIRLERLSELARQNGGKGKVVWAQGD